MPRAAMRGAVATVCSVAILSAVLGMSCGGGGRGEPESDRLNVPGTGACQPVLRTLAAAFNESRPGKTVTIPDSVGSSGGIRAVLAGKTPLCRVARTLKESEAAKGLRHVAFAQDAIVFAVGKDVPIDGLSSRQLVDLFSGKITNWKDVGGPDESVFLLIREEDDSSVTVIRRHIPAFRDIRFSADAKMAHHDAEMLAGLAKFRTAIGFATSSSLKATDSPARILALDGVSPSPEAVRSGAYRLVCDYGLVHPGASPKGLAGAFLAYVFTPEAGQIMERFGLTSMERN